MRPGYCRAHTQEQHYLTAPLSMVHAAFRASSFHHYFSLPVPLTLESGLFVVIKPLIERSKTMQTIISVHRPYRILRRAKSVYGLACLFALTLICALALSMPAMAAENLPAGSIAASPKGMYWQEAVAFCESQGGRLPLVGGKAMIPNAQKIPSGMPVEGFGTNGAKWPSNLPPYNTYWTGTEEDIPGRARFISKYDDDVEVSSGVKGTHRHRAICVPK